MAKIVFVDDDPDVSEIIIELLSRKGHEVRSTAQAEEALSFMQKDIPDLLITDVMLPQMNGFELCKQIKNAPATKHIPVLILTGRPSAKIESELRQVRADQYLGKPFENQDLLDKVEELLLRDR